MINKQMPTPAEAVSSVADGATVMISGFGGAGVPVNLIQAVEASAARELTLIVNTLRLIDTYAPELFGNERVKRAICSAARSREKEPAAFERQWKAGTLDIEMLPQGTFAERIRAGGAGVPAFFTPTGVGTPLTTGKEVREFDGRLCVLETALTADLAIMRGRVADRFGNVQFHGTQGNFGLAMATASRVAVVEVDEVVDEPLSSERIDIPGIYIQHVVAVADRR
ncbi:MAG: 3-oxoacid CoA-transferase subunit A [Gammaproteobacteria bacterium]|nr:3-oxoacid CoA-transferase subunit A [Gammaproteobacteria bacterium]